MTTNHPITPSPELVEKWLENWHSTPGLKPECRYEYIANCAAQWGADQELERCIADGHTTYGKGIADWLRSMRRPEPHSSTPPPAAGGLVARVAYAITGGMDEPINWSPEARAAILEVAKWLRERDWAEAPDWLELEAGR